MNVTPIKPQATEDRHVQFSEFVEVRYIEPTETAQVQPSLYSQRLERELKNRPCVEAQPQAQPTQSKPVRVLKNALHTSAVVFGAFVIPSFICLFLGPIGLVAPAALTASALICALLGGKQTEEMQQARAERAVEMSEYDPR